jgi:hypothetical protein
MRHRVAAEKIKGAVARELGRKLARCRHRDARWTGRSADASDSEPL